MIRDYEIVSPSLEGVLDHISLSYEGLKRPTELLKVADGPAKSWRKSEQDQKVLEEYFYDVYGIFMKKLSHFIVDSHVESDKAVQLQAMLQELVKVKKMLANY